MGIKYLLSLKITLKPSNIAVQMMLLFSYAFHIATTVRAVCLNNVKIRW